jgi:cytochrome c oxidase assembly factor CtaG
MSAIVPMVGRVPEAHLAPEPHADLALGVLAVAAGAGYLWAAQRSSASGYAPLERWRASAFLGGLAALALAESPWLRALAEIRFSAHMFQHLLFLQLAPPLLLAGWPVQMAIRAAPRAWTARVLRETLASRRVRSLLEWLARPLSVFVLYAGAMVVWHIPAAYEAALRSEALHVLEHGMFLATAMLWWRLLVSPMPRHHRASPHTAFALVFATGAIGDLIGAAITLSPRPLYVGYVTRGVESGVDVMADQRLGGLAMWLSGALYFAILFWLLVRSTRASGRAQVSE